MRCFIIDINNWPMTYNLDGQVRQAFAYKFSSDGASSQPSASPKQSLKAVTPPTPEQPPVTRRRSTLKPADDVTKRISTSSIDSVSLGNCSV